MFENLLAKIARALADKKIPYMVIGGQAVLLYGEPRLTRDIDITLGMDVDEFDKLKDVVEKLSLKVLHDEPDVFAQKTKVFPTIDEKTGIRVDFIFSFTEYERGAIKKSHKIKVKNTKVNFASAEDVVVHKIIAGRARDKEDVKNILLKNPNLNAQYIKNWLQKFDKSLDQNLSGRFEEITKEIK